MLGTADGVHRDTFAQGHFDDLSPNLSVYFTSIGLVVGRRSLEYGLSDLLGKIVAGIPRHGQHPIEDLAGYSLRLIPCDKPAQLVCGLSDCLKVIEKVLLCTKLHEMVDGHMLPLDMQDPS